MLQRGAPKLGKDGKPIKDQRHRSQRGHRDFLRPCATKERVSIKVLNTMNFKKSMHYNPFAYIH